MVGDGKKKHQAQIATWIRAVMREKGLRPTEWSLRAGMSRATVTRALDPKYPHVTTTTTLINLARAAGVPPPLDMGAGSYGIPAAPILRNILLIGLAKIAPEIDWQPERVMPLAQAIRLLLLELADHPDILQNPEEMDFAVRLALRLDR